METFEARLSAKVSGNSIASFAVVGPLGFGDEYLP